jgi:hypothetical protein
VPTHAQQPVGPVPGVAVHPIRGQAAVVVVGVGVRPVAGELVQRVVAVVGRGRRAVEGDDLLGAVARRVVGVVICPIRHRVQVDARIDIGIDQPR